MERLNFDGFLNIAVKYLFFMYLKSIFLFIKNINGETTFPLTPFLHDAGFGSCCAWKESYLQRCINLCPSAQLSQARNDGGGGWDALASLALLGGGVDMRKK